MTFCRLVVQDVGRSLANLRPPSPPQHTGGIGARPGMRPPAAALAPPHRHHRRLPRRRAGLWRPRSGPPAHRGARAARHLLLASPRHRRVRGRRARRRGPFSLR